MGRSTRRPRRWRSPRGRPLRGSGIYEAWSAGVIADENWARRCARGYVAILGRCWLENAAYAKWTPLTLAASRCRCSGVTDARAILKHDFTLVERDGELIGLIETEARSDHLYIVNIAVAVDFAKASELAAASSPTPSVRRSPRVLTRYV